MKKLLLNRVVSKFMIVLVINFRCKLESELFFVISNVFEIRESL